jgi:hypothetical protein
MKYIYLIQSLEEGYYKIGVSKNPQRRIKELQTGNSSPLKLVETYQSEYADKIERTLQRRYSHLNKEGEWFDMSIQEEVTFVKNCKAIEENLIFLKKNDNVFI